MYQAYYFFKVNERVKQSQFFKANPDLGTACAVWNMLDDYAAIVKFIFPKIRNHHLLHVSKQQEPLTLANIDDLSGYEVKDPEQNRTRKLSCNFQMNGEKNYDAKISVQIRMLCASELPKDPEKLVKNKY